MICWRKCPRINSCLRHGTFFERGGYSLVQALVSTLSGLAIVSSACYGHIHSDFKLWRQSISTASEHLAARLAVVRIYGVHDALEYVRIQGCRHPFEGRRAEPSRYELPETRPHRAWRSPEYQLRAPARGRERDSRPVHRCRSSRAGRRCELHRHRREIR